MDGDSETGYFYRDDKRFHWMDGLIFTPPGIYTLRASRPAQLKWKFSNLVTIDLALTREFSTYSLCCSSEMSSRMPLVKRQYTPPVKNPEELLHAIKLKYTNADPQDPMHVCEITPVILELSFDKHSGEWIFHKLRNKMEPNFITVAWEIMSEIAEDHVNLTKLIEWMGKE